MLLYSKMIKHLRQKGALCNFRGLSCTAKHILTVSLIVLLCLEVTPVQAASLNGKCKIKGNFSLSGNQLLTCKMIKGNLLWQKATKSEKASYLAILNQKIAASRQAELNDLLLNSGVNEFEVVTGVSAVWRIPEIQEWGKVLSDFKSKVSKSAESVKAKESELGLTQTQYNQKLQELQNNQSTRNTLESQVRSAEGELVTLKQSYDIASQNYLSAKSVSDSLYYKYQYALNENSAILANRVLCDFGFISGTSCSWGNYNYNASVISQYNSAIARTNSLSSNYSYTYSAYTNGLSRLSSLKNQSSTVNNSIAILNNQVITLQREIGTKQGELTKLKSENTIYEGKNAVVNRFLESIAGLESRLSVAIQEHNLNIDAFMIESDEVKVALQGKLLSDLQSNDWVLLISELKSARAKVSTSFSTITQISASLSDELSKATASSK